MLLSNALRRFDWSFEYSDDVRVWRKWYAKRQILLKILAKASCPHSWADLRRSFCKQIVEDYIEDETGHYYKQEWIDKGWNMYRPSAEELITRREHRQIQEWITEHDVELPKDY